MQKNGDHNYKLITLQYFKLAFKFLNNFEFLSSIKFLLLLNFGNLAEIKNLEILVKNYIFKSWYIKELKN